MAKSKKVTVITAGLLILVGNWKKGHTLHVLENGEAKEVLSFGGIEEKEGKKTRKLSPEELFAKIDKEVKLSFIGAKIYIVMLQPNIVIAPFFIQRGAKVFGIASFQGKCKGIEGQLKLVMSNLMSENGERKFAELTTARLMTSSVAALRGSDDELTKLRIAVKNRLWINEAVLKSMEICGLDQLTERRIKNKITGVFDYLGEGISLAEKETTYELEMLLKQEEVYKKVFEPVYQIGPFLAAKIISAIGTIDRFSTRAKLVAYAGLHVKSDGTCPRRKKAVLKVVLKEESEEEGVEEPEKKKETANWNNNLKTALYLWAKQLQLSKKKRPDDPWVKKFVQYYDAYVAEFTANEGKGKIQSEKHAFHCAFRKIGQKFLRYIWSEWRKVECKSDAVGVVADEVVGSEKAS